MLRRIWKAGRDFIHGPPVPVDDRTVEMLNDPDRDIEQCVNCRFRSTMTLRCMRIAGPYYKTPVSTDFVCSLFEPTAELDEARQESIQRLRLIEPRGGVVPTGYLARRMEMLELISKGKPNRCECQGCLTCFYNTGRDSGIGYEGCCFPGEIHQINPIDGGKFCPSWIKAED